MSMRYSLFMSAMIDMVCMYNFMSEVFISMAWLKLYIWCMYLLMLQKTTTDIKFFSPNKKITLIQSFCSCDKKRSSLLNILLLIYIFTLVIDLYL